MFWCRLLRGFDLDLRLGLLRRLQRRLDEAGDAVGDGAWLRFGQVREDDDRQAIGDVAGDVGLEPCQEPCSIVTDAYPDRKYPGVVDLISPEANRQKATVLVRVKVLQPD